MPTLPGWIRPLTLPNIENGISSHTRVDAILRDLCRGGADPTPDAVVARYREVSSATTEILFVPDEAKILERIVWPLRSAKQSYCLGDFLGSIGLSGIVCEMATVFIFDLGVQLWSLDKLDADLRSLVEKRDYGKKRQAERIKILKRVGAISDELAQRLTDVRRMRREYLHLLSTSYEHIQRDAAAALSGATRVVGGLVALPLGEGGRLSMPAHLRDYLSGIVADELEP